MSFAFMPLYVGDYVSDTRHLTPLKHGIYLQFLMHCWSQFGPLPLDEQECAGIANCRSADEIDAMRYVLGKYFVRMDDGFYNLRIQAEIERANAIAKQRGKAGKKGAEGRLRALKMEAEASAKQVLGKCQANASTTTTTTTTTTKEKIKDTVGQTPPDPPPVPTGKDLRAIARSVLDFLNERTGRAYKAVDANLDLIVARLREGYEERELRQVVARKCRQWAGDEKMAEYLRPATLFNRSKFAQYTGELVVPQGEDHA